MAIMAFLYSGYLKKGMLLSKYSILQNKKQILRRKKTFYQIQYAHILLLKYFEILQNRDNTSSLTSIFNLDNSGSLIAIFLRHFDTTSVCAWRMKKKCGTIKMFKTFSEYQGFLVCFTIIFSRKRKKRCHCFKDTIYTLIPVYSFIESHKTPNKHKTT